jgi:hypothetical protein
MPTARKPIFYRTNVAYRAFVTERNNGAVVTRFDDNNLKINWERKRNVATTATITVSTECDGIGEVDPWAHELHIEREGQEVWVGPVTKPTAASDGTATVVARDVLAWVQVRAVHTLLDYTAKGAGKIDPVTWAGLIIVDALTPDDPGLLDVLTLIQPGPTDDAYPLMERKVDPANGDMAWDDGLSQMLGTSIDSSAIGRRIVVWPTGKCMGAADGIISQTDIVQGFQVGRDGSKWASRIIVRGSRSTTTTSAVGTATSSSDAVVASYGRVDPRYGLVERRVSDQSVSSVAGAAEVARQKVYAFGGAPGIQLGADTETAASAGELDCDTDLDVNSISPGSCLPAELGVGGVIATGAFLVDGLEVDLGPAGESASVLLVRPAQETINETMLGTSALATSPTAPGLLPPPSGSGPGVSKVWTAGDSLTAGYPEGAVTWRKIIDRIVFNVSRGGSTSAAQVPGQPFIYTGWTDMTHGGIWTDYVRANVNRWGAPQCLVAMVAVNDWYLGRPAYAVAAALLEFNTWMVSMGTTVLWITSPPSANRAVDRRAVNTLMLTTFPHVVSVEDAVGNPDGTIKSAYNLGDGVHLNAAGHGVVAGLVKPALTALGF